MGRQVSRISFERAICRWVSSRRRRTSALQPPTCPLQGLQPSLLEFCAPLESWPMEESSSGEGFWSENFLVCKIIEKLIFFILQIPHWYSTKLSVFSVSGNVTEIESCWWTRSFTMSTDSSTLRYMCNEFYFNSVIITLLNYYIVLFQLWRFFTEGK